MGKAKGREKGSFIDGNDLCDQCCICCSDIDNLIATREELERVPKMKPFVATVDGEFITVNMPEGCPYLLPNGWCGTYETRPFDCSLYPLKLKSIVHDVGNPQITVLYEWAGKECPNRSAFLRKGMSEEQSQRLHDWLVAALGTERIRVREEWPFGLRRVAWLTLGRIKHMPVVRQCRKVLRRSARAPQGKPRMLADQRGDS